MKVAFVIVGWNNKDLLKECFDSIHSQDYKDISIYYVDNGSADNSVEYVTKNFPSVKLVDARKNTGFAVGNNIGIKAALQDEKVQYIALLNSDARIEKSWTSTIIKFAN
jgi:GT2 family glycosyltransferase